MSILRDPPGNVIGGRFIATPGDAIVSCDPADPERVIWSGTPVTGHADEAVQAARSALPAWSSRPFDERVAALRSWQAVTRANADRLADLICDEMGKTMAEARFEAGALAGKVDVTLDRMSVSRVTDYEVAVNDTRSGFCHFRPHGVMAVIGPFNFPAHLPNGQFVPALLMGNTVVFKPSEKTPAVGQLIAELMNEALAAVDAPPGVFNVVQGGGDIAATLTTHDDIDGILFTGSWPVGRRILEANLDRPGRIVALEMGGNNPTVVMDDASFEQAVIECARAAFATTGQRCTCTRRIIVQSGIAERFIPALCRVASTLLVGPGRSPDPVFMGPLVTDDARQAVLEAQQRLGAGGGRLLVPCCPLDRPGNFLTAGVVEVDRFDLADDCEVFGPLAQVSIVNDLDAAIDQANATRFGLAASIFTADAAAFDTFKHGVRAGCINHNTGTAGASSKLPFGGLGISGNHRPAAAFAADFCAYPMASMVERSTTAAVPAGMLDPDQWAARISS
ncbi:MAG: aldehyde dehydrogenase family protein [Planctomycetota bacterium]|jgi:succinylglutamic semialdehyde dehydrogenase